MKKSNKSFDSTLTYRVAAIQVKMLHLQYRMKKIFDDQSLLNEKANTYKNHREQIKIQINAAYSFIDMLVSMEHLHQLMDDIFATNELVEYFDEKTYKILNHTKKITQQWKFVRNKLDGHIDIESVASFCKRHNYKGVFISNDLEADLGVLNILLIESAVNSARNLADIFGRDLDFKKNSAKEIKVLVERLNKDWNDAFQYFKYFLEFMYKIGKKEKMVATDPDDWQGLVRGN